MSPPTLDEAATEKDATRGWQRLDRSAFGVVYGSIMVLSILLASGDGEAAFEIAAVLFGSVLAITLAKAFAEVMSHALETGARITRDAWRSAWRHSSPTLAVANLPTLLFCASGLGWIMPETVLWLSQTWATGLLVVLGARVGWVIDRRIIPALLGAAVAGGLGFALAVMKLVIH